MAENLFALLQQAHQVAATGDAKMYGVEVAVVTNVKDPLKQGRVKVCLPRLPGKPETDFVRVVQPAAGPGRGFYWLPHIHDEVLVAFERGEAHRPFVVGSLWNGKDKPMKDAYTDENTTVMLQSKSGHQVLLNDKDGEETIIIADKSGKRTVTFDVKNQKFLIEAAEGDLVLNAAKKIVFDCEDLEVKAKKKGTIDIGSKFDLTIKGKGQLAAGPVMNMKASRIDFNDGGSGGGGGGGGGGGAAGAKGGAKGAGGAGAKGGAKGAGGAGAGGAGGAGGAKGGAGGAGGAGAKGGAGGAGDAGPARGPGGGNLAQDVVPAGAKGAGAGGAAPGGAKPGDAKAGDARPGDPKPGAKPGEDPAAAKAAADGKKQGEPNPQTETLTGTLVNAAGTPLKNWPLRLIGPEGMPLSDAGLKGRKGTTTCVFKRGFFYSDAEGKYSFEGLVGKYKVELVMPAVAYDPATMPLSGKKPAGSGAPAGNDGPPASEAPPPAGEGEELPKGMLGAACFAGLKAGDPTDAENQFILSLAHRSSNADEHLRMMRIVYKGFRQTGAAPPAAAGMSAQFAVESGWGKSCSGKLNYFGIKGEPGTLCNTTEHNLSDAEVERLKGKGLWISSEPATKSDGTPYTIHHIKAAFRDYSSVKDALQHLYDLLAGKTKVKNYIKHQVLESPTPEEYCKRIREAGFATAVDYTEVLKGALKTVDQYAFHKKGQTNEIVQATANADIDPSRFA